MNATTIALVLTSVALAGCYRSHRIGEDGGADGGVPDVAVDAARIDAARVDAGPPQCWITTAGPTFLTEAPPTAYAGFMIPYEGGALLGHASEDREGERPRTLEHVDARGLRASEPELLFEAPDRNYGPAVELVSTSLGIVAGSFSLDRGCEVRALGEEAIALTPVYCRALRPSPSGGLLMRLDGIGPEAPNRRFAYLSRTRPLRFEEGPVGLFGGRRDSWSFKYEPLDRERLVAVRAPRDGGPLETGTMWWRTAESQMTPALETTNDLRQLRLLPNRGGWALGYLERTTGDSFRLGMMQLDAEGRVVGPIVHPDVGPSPDTGWDLARRGDELVLLFTNGEELRLASIDEDFLLTAAPSTLERLVDLAHIRVIALDDGAVLVAFTEHSVDAGRVGTLRAECFR